MPAPLPLSLALAQINPTVGDIEGNAAKIRKAYAQAAAGGAQLVITPELALIGYPPEDLVLKPGFRKRAMEAAKKLAQETKNGVGLIVGSLWEADGRVFNAALLMSEGRIQATASKNMLPNYGIFDEKRLFTAGELPRVISFAGVRLGLMVCEDIWHPHVPEMLSSQNAQMLITINASPFERGKMALRQQVARDIAEATRLPLAYVNLVGGQDDIVFDGGSFVIAADGEVTHQLPEFKEALEIINRNASKSELLSVEETIWRAMAMGLKDYVQKNNFKGVLLGLSGGIDSALSATLTVDALGADNVLGVLLPSPYTSDDSNKDALALAKNLGIKTETIPIEPGMQAFGNMFNSTLKSNWEKDLATGGNIQARLRGMILMAISNATGKMLLSTGNKSELAVGYSTLYGDSCGGYNVLKDLYKTEVYTLAMWRNGQGALIPENSIMRPPSAELAPGQTDQDQLPPYETLDAILRHFIEGQLMPEAISGKGFERALVEKICRMVDNSEYKRRQSTPGVKLSPMLFGRDRRIPLTNKELA